MAPFALSGINKITFAVYTHTTLTIFLAFRATGTISLHEEVRNLKVSY